MRKFFSLAVLSAMITASATFTSCQTRSEKENVNREIQQVDTPKVAEPTDVIKEPQSDTLKNTTDMKKDTSNTTTKKPLVLNIDNLGSPTAPVEISIYSPDDKFPSEKGNHKTYRFKPTSGNKLTAEITDIPYGEYAVATYQDLDADGKIAKNMIGMPTDPFAFSNNYVPKIKAPSFKDCKFEYDDKSASVNISMIRKD